MDLLCKVCDHEIFENYIATLRKNNVNWMNSIKY